MDMHIKSIVPAIFILVLSTISDAAFLGRLPATPGSTDYQAYYDTQLDITWLTDTNAGAGSTFDDGSSTTDGAMSWENANAWAASLNVNGVTGWRLPTIDVNGDGVIVHCGYFSAAVSQEACMDNEYGHMFAYGEGTTFGNGITPLNPSPFNNLVIDGIYWTSDESDDDPLDAWHIAMFVDIGFQQSTALKSFPDHAWPVHDGDVAFNYGNFTMLDSDGNVFGGTNDLIFNWDGTVNTVEYGTNFNMTIVSDTPWPFFGFLWTAHDIRVFGTGTYSFDTGCTVAEIQTTGCPAGSAANSGPAITMTIGPGQVGAHILLDWNTSTNIDIVNVWNQNDIWDTHGDAPPKNQLWTGLAGEAPVPFASWDLVSTDANGDGINGSPMLDGPFQGFYANFNANPSDEPVLTDTDGDGVTDNIDNCMLIPNPTQCDGNSDGYGNHCDADFNNDGIVDRLDVGPLVVTLGTANPVTDLTCDGIVNRRDVLLFRYLFGSPPGPSYIDNPQEEEPNNTWQTATILPQDIRISGTQSDDDWYVINAVAGGRILIDLTFTLTDGNIDLAFFDDSGVIGEPTFPGILRANSVTDNSDHEFIDNDISVRGPGTYYIRVYGGTGGDHGNSYRLTWAELTGADDDFEENDSNAAAAAIAESSVAFGSQSDEDWYSINADADGTRMFVSLRFNATDDLDLELRDAAGNLLASSMNGVGVNEVIDFTVATMGVYHLKVSGNDNGDGYAIDWEGN